MGISSIHTLYISTYRLYVSQTFEHYKPHLVDLIVATVACILVATTSSRLCCVSYRKRSNQFATAKHILFQYIYVVLILNDVFNQNGGRIVGLAFSYGSGYVFWSDISLGKRGIYRTTTDSAGNFNTDNVVEIVSDGEYGT